MNDAVEITLRVNDGPERKLSFGCFWPTLIGGLLLLTRVIL